MTETTKTPPRHSYANAHSPIASIKRKRNAQCNLSPMHPPTEDETSWVERKVDALFSPVLSFLNTSTTEDTNTAVTQDEDEESQCESMAAMEDVQLDEDEFNPWQFIKGLPSYARVQHMRPPITLPEKNHKAPITLVLDLDETLVHCTVEPIPDADLTFPVDFHGTLYQVHVRLRPHLFTFLDRIQDKFEVIVFTASQKVYANELLNRIDPENKYFHHRLYRESCLNVEGNFLKDLTVLGRSLKHTVLVDNSPHAFGYQVDNGIPIESWFDDPNDKELLKLERFLRTLNVDDVRSVVKEKFGCYKLIANAKLD